MEPSCLRLEEYNMGSDLWFTHALTDTPREGMTRLGSPPAKGWIAQLDIYVQDSEVTGANPILDKKLF